MPRCFVHIGAPKTGTTYLQRFFTENAVALRDAGVLYPAAGLRGFGHHDLAFLLSGGYPDWATPQPRTLDEITEDLKSELRASNARDVLFSSEDFYLFPAPEALRHVLEHIGALTNRKAAIIVYLRRQDHAHESWYNQTIKAQGYDHDIDASIQEFFQLWDYQYQLALWENVFGRDALVVRAYEAGQFRGGSLLEDVLETLGLGSKSFRAPLEAVNTSLNYDLLELQRHINRMPLTVQQKRRFHHELMALSQHSRGTGLFDEKPVVDGVRAAAILAAYAASNRAVAREYFERDDLFFDEVCGQVGPSANREGLTVEKMLHFLGYLAARESQ